jgi:hypothetical protein
VEKNIHHTPHTAHIEKLNTIILIFKALIYLNVKILKEAGHHTNLSKKLKGRCNKSKTTIMA